MMKHLKTYFNVARPAMTLLAILCSVLAWADNISDEQALQLAQQFVSRHASAAGPRHAPAATQQVVSAGQVSGLYVFNVGNDDGFVIVSNDDRTTPILGYSDSGSLDTENIPSNMRAWLQGYADEIAWLQAQTTQATVFKSPLRVVTRQNVAPLLSTTWNQSAPYNNQTPYYKEADGTFSYSATSRSGYTHCATGCAATALAQVMNYHEWPQSATSAIPSYTWASPDIQLNELPATTFDWNNMLDSYNSSYSDAQRDAIAKLMQYCGWALEMNYGKESGASLYDAVYALKSYFNYNETGQYVMRRYYNEDNWTALIYYEVANGRPVLYGGQSSGGGHAFVLDGYKYENETEFFHINWGWGSLSDGYFTLSDLNPYSQGIGGSSSQDGFNNDQEAVIGVQKYNDTGEMSGIQPKEINLKLNSMTLGQNPVYIGSTVNVVLNVTNNAADDFDGPLYLGRKMGESYLTIAQGDFSIPARGTADCNIQFTPDAVGTYDLVFRVPVSGGLQIATSPIVYATLNVLEQGLPYDLAATEITHNSALISWSGNADSYDLRYGIIPEGYSTTPAFWLQYDNDSPSGAFGTNNTYEWTWGVMYPGEKVTGSSLTKVSFYENTNISSDIKVSIYTGGDNAPETKLYEETVTPLGYNSFHEVTFATPVGITPGQNLWITLTAKGTHLMAICQTTTDEPNNQWIKNGGWTTLGNLGINNYGWLIRGFVESPSIDDINGSWPVVTCNGSFFRLAELNPATNYAVQVRGNNATNSTAWTTLSFTTLPNVILADNAATNSETLAQYADGQELSVTLGARTLYKDGAWNTICLPFNLTLQGSPLEGAEAKTLANATMTGTHVELTFGDAVDVLQAGVPYIIKWNGGNNIEAPTFTNVTIVSTEGQTITKADGHVKFIGYYDAFDITPTNTDIYYMTAENKLKYTGINRTLKACRAYFQFSEAAAARQFVLDFGDGDMTTGIIDIENSKSPDGKWYDLQGRKLSNDQMKKGLYIKDGKKLMVK